MANRGKRQKWTSVSGFYDADMVITVKDMVMVLKSMEEEFGEESIIRFDAGYNNIDMEIWKVN